MPDQKQIVAQYCRYAGEIRTGKNVKQMVGRALQLATSDPKGPAYLMGAREVMEEEIEPYNIRPEHWRPCAAGAIPAAGVSLIAEELVRAKEPLLITGYSGRKPECVQMLVQLSNLVKGLRVLDTGACDMCFPADHPASLGVQYGSHPAVETADVILVLDCDVPWIPTQGRPQISAHVYHIDVDPLKRLMPLYYIPALERYTADAYTAVDQIVSYIQSSPTLQAILNSQEYLDRWGYLQKQHQVRITELDAQGDRPVGPNLNTSYLCSKIRQLVPPGTIFAVEAVTNTVQVTNQLRATLPGEWIHCGGGGLGWSGGGALGIKLASDAMNKVQGSNKRNMVVQIVGDGSFMFSVPSSVYWISSRYQIPILTIVLNNKGKKCLSHESSTSLQSEHVGMCNIANCRCFQAGMPHVGQCS